MKIAQYAFGNIAVIRVLRKKFLSLRLPHRPELKRRFQRQQRTGIGVHDGLGINDLIEGIGDVFKRERSLSERNLISLMLPQEVDLILLQLQVAAVGLFDIGVQIHKDVARLNHGDVVLRKLRCRALGRCHLSEPRDHFGALSDTVHHQLAAADSQRVVGKVGIRLLLRLLLRLSVCDQLLLLFLDIGGAIRRIFVHQPQDLAVAGIGLAGCFIIEQRIVFTRNCYPVSHVFFRAP